MFKDEFRSPEEMQALRLDLAMADPEGTFKKLLGMSGAEQERELQSVLRELSIIKSQLVAAEKTAKSALNKANRAEREKQLAEQRLRNVRQSTTMKFGRTILYPAQIARKAASNPEKVPDALLRNLRKGFHGVKGKARAANTSWFKGKNERQGSGNDSPLLETFKSNPTSVNLERVVSNCWYAKGQINVPHQLILDHPQLIDGFSDKGKILADRIKGAVRLLERLSIPERSGSPAYEVEDGRVMYCVHSTPIFNSNGYSTRTRGLVAGLNRSNSDVVVVARAGYPWDTKVDIAKPGEFRTVETLDGVDYVHIPGGNLNRDGLDSYVMQAADAFVREARILRPSLIQSASNFRTALPALIAARRLGIPFVYEVRGLWELTEASAKPEFLETERFETMRQLETLVAMEADQVFAITNQVRDELVDRGVEIEKISILPNAVDTNSFCPIPADTAYAASKGISLESPIVGFAGSIVDYEGLDILIEASSKLSAKGIEHQVVIAGSGPAEKSLKDTVTKRSLKNVKFLGRLPQSEMMRLQSIFDVAACPRKSQIITELVSPLKPLEAFACSKPVVLSDVAPHRDLAADGRAVLFEAEDSDSLASQLGKLFSDKDLRAQYGRTARLWAVRERNWSNLGKQVQQAYKRLLKQSDAQSAPFTSLGQVKVGVIADEFTRTTLSGSFDVELLDRSNWQNQLERTKFDLIFVESAWEGNDGQWTRGIGYYSEEENADLFKLLETAGNAGIPRVFWNKEDPVHFARFAPTAALFDHVFTTDANMIPKYWATPGHKNLTVSALPFYAEPSIHNPLPTNRAFRKTVAYAGTYYGDRYKDRSQGLDSLLEAANEFGLEIYDRQANNPDSPYRFPLKYGDAVRGSLTYDEVIESYKSHVAHLNVNSVLDSPTMFSRRVVEIPASGGIVLSAGSRGVNETLGNNIANSDMAEDQRAWLNRWTNNSESRLNEIWRQMRTIYRSHTTQTALTILCRTAGVPVDGFQRSKYSVEGEHLTKEIALKLTRQSHKPTTVSVARLDSDTERVLLDADISVGESHSDANDYIVDAALLDNVRELDSRTFFEDLLLTTKFGDWDAISVGDTGRYDGETAVVVPSATGRKVLSRNVPSGAESVQVFLPTTVESNESKVETHKDLNRVTDLKGKKILIAGHDLKFASFLIDHWSESGVEVLIDNWASHTKHDEEQSLGLLRRADIVFCEWGLGNAVWYSKNVREDQRLIVRVHSQELFRPFLSQIVHENVDKFIFVGELIRKAAVISHGVPEPKTVIVPNPVDVEALARPKAEGSEFGIGLVGIVPQSKRLDIALDILEQLLEVDERYHLRIKGKTPADYPWMKNRPTEMEYYDQQFSRIDDLNKRFPGAVRLDGFGADMPEWYTKVGHVLSVSDFESFHLTIADGVATGAQPSILAWPGSDFVYPSCWLSRGTKELVEKIINKTPFTVSGCETQIGSIEMIADSIDGLISR